MGTEPMTAEEFNRREAELLGRLPEELRSPISWMAYERGHAYGHEEVLNHVLDMVTQLEEPLRLYGTRMAAPKTIDSIPA